MARCSSRGSWTSLTSTRVTVTPQGSVAWSSTASISLEIAVRSAKTWARVRVPKVFRSVVWAKSLVDAAWFWTSQTLSEKKRKNSIRKKLLTNWVSDLVVNDGVNGNCDGIRGQNLLWLETGSTNLPFFIDFQLSTLAGISKLISRISTRMKSSVHGKIQKFPGPWGPPSSFPNRNFTARSYCETTL